MATLTADTITDKQILDLVHAGLVGDAGKAALGESIERGFEGLRSPDSHERQVARARCAEIWNVRAAQQLVRSPR